MAILDSNRSRMVSIDFIDDPYHVKHYSNEREPCLVASQRRDNNIPQILHSVCRLQRNR